MPTTIVMPQLGESVAEGVIGKWLKAEGDTIARDEPIVEVITDKVNAEIPSPVAGVLQRISQPEGATVAVGQEIAVIGDGDAAGAGTGSGGVTASTPASVSSGGGSSAGGGPSAAPSASNGHSGGGVAVATAPAAPAAIQAGGRADRVRSSPLVRRLAEEHGIDLALVPGTGIGGRVSKNDILQFIAAPHPEAAATVAPVAVPRPAGPPVAPQQARNLGADEERITLSPIRKLIAERMAFSKSTIPHAVTIVEVDMTKVVRYREARKDEFRAREGVALSYVAFVIKATVEALKEFPDVNSEWGGDHIIRKNRININVAVDAPDGLTTPVIHDADGRSLAGLSHDIYDLAMRARNKKLTMDDMQGGTFTVNNTGAIGSVWSMSIIPPPQCGILAAAAIVKRPVVLEVDGEDTFAVRHMMNLSFSFDHRILDGGYAAGFVQSVKDKLESWSADYPLY
jgi:2-oxoisovalerate dehydrogenase E2 component (dihydrolipoyl transacylase)